MTTPHIPPFRLECKFPAHEKAPFWNVGHCAYWRGSAPSGSIALRRPPLPPGGRDEVGGMRVRVGCEFAFESEDRVPLLVLVEPHPLGAYTVVTASRE